MNVYQLLLTCLIAILKGRGKSPVYFDTEARHFHYHMAKIGKAYCEDIDGTKNYWLNLYEEE